jgi:uncharacterized ferredoxin-like protein
MKPFNSKERQMDNGVLTFVADLMAISARTAPKASGWDFLEIRVIQGKEVARLGESMVKYGKARKSIVPQNTGKNTEKTPEFMERAFVRDGENVKNSAAVLLVGIRKGASAMLHCGGCGVERCTDRRVKKGVEFNGVQCGFRLLDLGIALGSAAKTAGILNVDNRMMYTAGVVAKRLGLLEGDWVIGIPLSATGKNIFVDRPSNQG